MDKDQIKIKYVKQIKGGKKKGQRFLYPKSYIFNLSAETQAEFCEQLQIGRRGLVDVPKFNRKGQVVTGKTVKVPFEIIDLGHFDNEPHKLLKVVTMFKREQKESQSDQAEVKHDDQCDCK